MVTNREAVEALVRTEVNARMQSELALGVKVDGIRDTVTAQQQLVEVRSGLFVLCCMCVCGDGNATVLPS